MKGRRGEIEAAVTALGGDDEVDQLGLALRAPDAAVEDALNEPAAAVAVRRGRGRPPGAKNRRTTEMVEYCERVLGEPLLVKAVRVVGVETKALAKGLACSRLEAYRLQMQVLVAALPYMHQKLPLAVDVSARVAVPLSIFTGGDVGETLDQAVERVATVLDLLPEPDAGSEQYQRVADGSDAGV